MTEPYKASKPATAAILAAGGVGSRFASSGQAAPKQFLSLAGRPMYVWPLLRLAAHPLIGHVVVVVPQTAVSPVRQSISELTELPDLCKISVTAGGATRQESVHYGLHFLGSAEAPPEMVLIHDGARPFLTTDLINAVIAAALEHGASVPCLAVTDTIKRVSNGKIMETLDRAELFTVQTPQAGRFSDLANAHHQAVSQGWSVTDDASILEKCGHGVAVVPGSPYNLKVTQPLDLLLCEALAPTLLKEQAK